RLTNTNNFAALTPFNSITFSGSNYIVSGNSIQLFTGFTLPPPAATNTLNCPLTLLSNETFTCAGNTTLKLGDLNIGTNVLLANVSGDATVNGAISGNGQLTKLGTGTLTLISSATFLGTLTVTVGVLNPGNGFAIAPVIVNGGTLGGGLAGTINVLSGTVSPGFSPAILNSSNVTFSSSGVFRVELNGTTAGSGYDQLNISGTVDLGGSTLNASLGFTPAISNSFTIINNDGADAVTNTFAGLNNGATFLINDTRLGISYAG